MGHQTSIQFVCKLERIGGAFEGQEPVDSFLTNFFGLRVFQAGKICQRLLFSLWRFQRSSCFSLIWIHLSLGRRVLSVIPRYKLQCGEVTAN